MSLTKVDYVVFACFLIVFSSCMYFLGYNKAKMEKPITNDIQVVDILNEQIKISQSVEKFDPSKETILYVSSDIKDKDNETLNRIGIRFIGDKKDNNKFFVEICDSVNKACVFSVAIDRKLNRDKIESFDSNFIGD